MNLTYPLLLDGGLSNELQRQGCCLNNSLWSAKLLESNPEAIVLAHFSYLQSGARCIITSSYQASLPGFMALGHDESSASALILKSVHLAEEARNRFLSLNPRAPKPFIAASIGPYGAYLADGSEYRGDYTLSDSELTAFHEPRIRLLADSQADMLACETIPSFREAMTLCRILENISKPAWISFSAKDGQHISDGTPIEKCAALFAHHPSVFAIGVNCTSPEFVSELIRSIKTQSGKKKIVVYPNAGAVYHAESKTWSGLADLSSCALMAKEWMDLGADIIGGCCGIGPEQIKSMNTILMNSRSKHTKPSCFAFGAMAALLIGSSAAMAEKPGKIGWIEPVKQEIEGWTVHVDPQLIGRDHEKEGRRALSMLANHLERIAILVPEKQLADLRRMEIWIEREHPELDSMQYHPDAEWLIERGYDPRLAKKVHITRAAELLSRDQMLKHPAVILHELAHAYHDQVLGFDEPGILAAFNKAMKAGTYENVLLFNGEIVKHYATTDHKEYFAETTEAYFYRNDFYPFVRAELLKHDPAGHAEMVRIWQE